MIYFRVPREMKGPLRAHPQPSRLLPAPCAASRRVSLPSGARIGTFQSLHHLLLHSLLAGAWGPMCPQAHSVTPPPVPRATRRARPSAHAPPASCICCSESKAPPCDPYPCSTPVWPGSPPPASPKTASPLPPRAASGPRAPCCLPRCPLCAHRRSRLS